MRRQEQTRRHGVPGSQLRGPKNLRRAIAEGRNRRQRTAEVSVAVEFDPNFRDSTPRDSRSKANCKQWLGSSEVMSSGPDKSDILSVARDYCVRVAVLV